MINHFHWISEAGGDIFKIVQSISSISDAVIRVMFDLKLSASLSSVYLLRQQHNMLERGEIQLQINQPISPDKYFHLNKKEKSLEIFVISDVLSQSPLKMRSVLYQNGHIYLLKFSPIKNGFHINSYNPRNYASIFQKFPLIIYFPLPPT